MFNARWIGVQSEFKSAYTVLEPYTMIENQWMLQWQGSEQFFPMVVVFCLQVSHVLANEPCEKHVCVFSLDTNHHKMKWKTAKFVRNKKNQNTVKPIRRTHDHLIFLNIRELGIRLTSPPYLSLFWEWWFLEPVQSNLSSARSGPTPIWSRQSSRTVTLVPIAVDTKVNPGADTPWNQNRKEPRNTFTQARI